LVERLKKAIDKARAHREQVLAGAAPRSVSPEEWPRGPVEATAPADPSPWAALEEITLDAAHLERGRVVSYRKSDPAHAVFDVLRTRLLKVFKDNGWSRLAVTSPTKGCGKTFVAANLALSLARQTECQTVLIDMDLKVPDLAGTLGLTTPCPIERYLTGQTQPEAYFRRVGPNLALGLNTERVHDSAELIQDGRTIQALARMRELYRPDAVIYDLPPMLVSDDTIGFLPQVDCVLLVAAAGQTKSAEIEECERFLGETTNFLGVVLNKCEVKTIDAYQYGYYG
jgi:Mrp family chromosome partitioning ATPase